MGENNWIKGKEAMSSQQTSVAARQERQKNSVLEQLKKTPVVEIACKKVGIGRSTYYRWRKEDASFLEATHNALETGCSLINDMAESQLIKAIQDGNMTGIIFWLKNHHYQYTNKLEVTAKVTESEVLTEEQQAVVKRALTLASLIDNEDSSHTK